MRPDRKLPCCWPLVALLLLFILIQLLCALILSHGKFVSSNNAWISPFNICLRGQDGAMTCTMDYYDSMATAGGAETNNHLLRMLIILSLYVPLVLVPFGLMAFLFAVLGKDGGVLRLSIACQALSSLLMLLGLCVFVGLHWPYVSLASMTAGYYNCVTVFAELILAARLTWMSGRRLTEDEQTEKPIKDCCKQGGISTI